MPTTIRPCSDPASIARLLPLATEEGLDYLERLITDWTEGVNRFEAAGEVLFLLERDGQTVACGGLLRQREKLGRIRRIYVDPMFRRHGLGRELIAALIDHSRGSFDELVLYTENPNAARLYEQHGFVPEAPASTPDNATHRLTLKPGGP